MSRGAPAKIALRRGTRFGVAAAVLLVLGPFINRNFGVADSLSSMPLSAVWETAPVAVLVTVAYLVLLLTSVLLCAVLVTVSLTAGSTSRRLGTHHQAGA